MQYDGSSAESASVSRPRGLLGALDQVEVCIVLCAVFDFHRIVSIKVM